MANPRTVLSVCVQPVANRIQHSPSHMTLPLCFMLSSFPVRSIIPNIVEKQRVPFTKISFYGTITNVLGALAKLAIALHWQCRDHRFESGKLHQRIWSLSKIASSSRKMRSFIFTTKRHIYKLPGQKAYPLKFSPFLVYKKRPSPQKAGSLFLNL